jgi:hypothetical protein
MPAKGCIEQSISKVLEEVAGANLPEVRSSLPAVNLVTVKIEVFSKDIATIILQF